MESKHTPGPWAVNIDSDINQIVIDSNEHSTCAIDCPAHVAMDNANLIACAPEMLEALEHARDQIKDFIMIAAPLGGLFDKTEGRFHNNVTLREIESVLAKAKGGKQ